MRVGNAIEENDNSTKRPAGHIEMRRKFLSAANPLQLVVDAATLLRDNRDVHNTGSDSDFALAMSMVKNATRSKSQIFQDLMVLFELEDLENGFFVEFGACDGKHFSNTYLLEKSFGWNGVVAEPSPVWHDRLFQERSCHISTKCVFTKSGEMVVFNEAPDPALSTVDSYSDTDQFAEVRAKGRRLEVPTITLSELLREADAPSRINYLSIDTEGSELDILSTFDFSTYKIDIITVEHNYRADRAAINSLLVSNGYQRKYERLSQFDDWYIRGDL